jgi:hypothetical protein
MPARRPTDRPALVVFVHGWSVRSSDTYGKLPERVVEEARARKWRIEARHVFLGKYVSFRDEITVDDLARGFEHALRAELGDTLTDGTRFACITHSTGGPVVRHWWSRFYLKSGAPCPMSHLIMLAPANFGSALAQLGKDRITRLKAWFDQVEPGTGVLDWLELGSPESWALNQDWIERGKDFASTNGVYPFVLTGQAIDRKLYDHVNAYTGEPGSDGVVRAAAANLNATYLRLVERSADGAAGELVADRPKSSPVTAFKIVPRSSHSGKDLGILRSVKDDGKPHPTLEAVMRCLEVSAPQDYVELTKAFAAESDATQSDERVDVVSRRLLPDSIYLIDRFSMVIFRIRDDQGNQIGEFDLKLTGIPANARGNVKASPDLLPTDFLQDRQRNRRRPETLTFFLNQDLMVGCPAIHHPRKPEVTLRAEAPGLKALGLQIIPHLTKGFVHFVPAELDAATATIQQVLKPNQTTLVEVVMKRIIGQHVFRLQRLDRRDDTDFASVSPGEPIDDETT